MAVTVMTDIESPAKKRIALVAHDNMKDEMLEWAQAHRAELAQHTLVGTGTTGRIVAEHTGLEVERLKSGPLGGDQQLGGRIAEGRVDTRRENRDGCTHYYTSGRGEIRPGEIRAFG